MTEEFGDYAAVYDLLYAEKDYAAEAAFVLARAAEALGGPPASVLDLGCGTARHALALAAAGVAVTGVERSAEMLGCARRNLAEAAAETARRVTLVAGDACGYRDGRRYDLVTLLFHVMSYQTADADVRAALATARAHLAPGGALLFDYWHAPAVAADPPSLRVREVENAAIRVRRRSDPSRGDDGLVRIAYRLEVRDKASETSREIAETHLMRPFDTAEIADFCAQSGFAVVRQAEFLGDRAADASTFGVYALCRAA